MSSTVQLLEACSEKLLKLDHRIDRIRSSVSELNPAAPPPTPEQEYSSDTSFVEQIVWDIMEKVTGTKPKRAPPRCHECHGPLRGYHHEYPHGINICELEHYDLCEGHILEGKNRSGHFWRGCPKGYVPPGSKEHDSGDSDSADDKKSLRSSSEESEYRPSRETSPTKREKIGTRSQPDNLAQDLNDLGLSTKSKSEGSVFPPPANKKSHLGKSKEDLLLEAELAEIEVLKEREKKMELLRQARLEKQKMQDRLDHLSNQGVNVRKKKSLHDVVDTMHVSNQEERQSRRSSYYSGPNMDTIRKDGHTKRKVDKEMEDIVEIPSLSNARPDVLTRRGFPVPRVKSSGRRDGEFLDDDGPIYQNRDKVSNQRVRESASVTHSREEDVLYKLVTEYDRFGKPFKTLVEHVVQIPSQRRSEPVTAWSYDHQPARVFRSPSPVRRDTSGKNYYQHRHRDISSPQPRQREAARTPVRARRAATVDDRVPRMVSIESRSSEDREGKTLNLTDHAKNLPVEFAKTATSKNLNFALWVYASVSELHSSLIGITPPIENIVIEAKLQHIMNVVHVTCLNSNAAEYKPISWSVGRTYHNLIQAKVDSGREHWSQFESLYRGSPHAAEMVAAEREHRTALLKVPAAGGVKREEPKSSKKRPCTTWNESDVEGKCKYEVEHPGEKCNRQHSCTHCDKKGFTRNHHQDRFCKRKNENEK